MSNIQKQHKISPAIAWLTIQKFIIFYCPLDGEHTTATEGNYVAEATLRRRRILQAGMLFHKRNHNDFIGEERKI